MHFHRWAQARRVARCPTMGGGAPSIPSFGCAAHCSASVLQLLYGEPAGDSCAKPTRYLAGILNFNIGHEFYSVLLAWSKRASCGLPPPMLCQGPCEDFESDAELWSSSLASLIDMVSRVNPPLGLARGGLDHGAERRGAGAAKGDIGRYIPTAQKGKPSR